MSVKIYSKDRYKWGHRNILPFLGETQISMAGEVECPSQEAAQQVVDLNIGFFFSLEDQETTTTTTITTASNLEILPQVEQNDLGKAPQNNIPVSIVEGNEDLSKSIDTLSVTELQKLAAVFPKSEWQNLRKAELVEYLKNKLT